MNCPFCHKNQAQVIDSRSYPDRVRRRRKCLQCGERWSTIEHRQDVFTTARNQIRSSLEPELKKIEESLWRIAELMGE